jgi:hypothetical protein
VGQQPAVKGGVFERFDIHEEPVECDAVLRQYAAAGV